MGTRSFVTVCTAELMPFVTLDIEYDGYPSGVGKDLVTFFEGARLVNGLPPEPGPERLFNGGGCLAAQLVARLKKRPGNVYLAAPPRMFARSFQEWGYIVFVGEQADPDRRILFTVQERDDAFGVKVLLDKVPFSDFKAFVERTK